VSVGDELAHDLHSSMRRTTSRLGSRPQLPPIGERIPAQRNGSWAAQSVKNLVKRYEKLPTRPFQPQLVARMPRQKFRWCHGRIGRSLPRRPRGFDGARALPNRRRRRGDWI